MSALTELAGGAAEAQTNREPRGLAPSQGAKPSRPPRRQPARQPPATPTGAPPAGRPSPKDDPFGLLAQLDEGAWPAAGAWPATGAWPAAGTWPPERPETPPPPGQTEVCASCGGQMISLASDIEHVCGSCGLVVEDDSAEPESDEAPRAAPRSAGLRVVGPGSRQLQPDLYRSGCGTTAASQKKQIYEEYLEYMRHFIQNGGRAFPRDACAVAAEYYNIGVQQVCVKRMQNKKTIMASCLQYACCLIGFAPTNAEVAAFMQLQSKGIARGDNYVRGLVADGTIELDVNADRIGPEVTTLFAHLGLEGDRFAGLRGAVRDIVETAVKNNIATNSILRSKVAAATYTVLTRCRDKSLVPTPVDMQVFCAARIRKNTLQKCLEGFGDYHSYFEPCYVRAGLDASRRDRS